MIGLCDNVIMMHFYTKFKVFFIRMNHKEINKIWIFLPQIDFFANVEHIWAMEFFDNHEKFIKISKKIILMSMNTNFWRKYLSLVWVLWNLIEFWWKFMAIANSNRLMPKVIPPQIKVDTKKIGELSIERLFEY